MAKGTTKLRSKKGMAKTTCYYCREVTVDVVKMGGVICGQCRKEKELSPQERDKMYIGDIKCNQVQCMKCKDIITSKNRHDFVTCRCGKVSADGGSWYLKRCGAPEDCLEMSTCFKQKLEESK